MSTPPDSLPSSPSELGARLREARTARGWTQDEAAKALGVARTTMVAIEKGQRRLKPPELLKLASLYGRQLSVLLRPSFPPSGFSVQLRGAIPPNEDAGGELAHSINELERLFDDYLELGRIVGAPGKGKAPPEYSIEGLDPERLAEDVSASERDRLALGQAPILHLREVLEEDVGLLVFFQELPSRVAGMFVALGPNRSALAINRNHPAERRRHTMAHEYGHYLTNRYKSEITILGRYRRQPAEERFAEAFGRALLMPARSLSRKFNEVDRQRRLSNGRGATPSDLCKLAHYYFVSFEALTRRLEELGLVRPGTWERLRGEGFRPNEARQLLGLAQRASTDDFLPSEYRTMAIEAWHRGALSEGQLAAFLRMDRLGARRLARNTRPDGNPRGHQSELFLPLDDLG